MSTIAFSDSLKAQCTDAQQPSVDEGLSAAENVCRRSVLAVRQRQADERLVLREFDELLRSLSSREIQFIDDEFPASSQSLCTSRNSFPSSALPVLLGSDVNSSVADHIQWLRPEQINPPDWSDNAKHKWAVFRDPRPNDVLQGALGDCWFITALSVLAEEPEYLMKVLVTREYNYEGLYFIRLCKDGEWIQVRIDDRLPCTFTKRLAYSQARRKQLWVPLIEKALAKLNGSYEAIVAGRCCEGLSTVTGSPCDTLTLGQINNPDDKSVDYDVLWRKLVEARSQRFLMCAMCSNSRVDKQDFKDHGLLNSHAYSLQDVQQSADGKLRLVKLRNPWGGTHTWNGDWSDESPLWTRNPELRRTWLKEKRSQRDGVFWMPFESFVKYFECVDICKIRPDWYEVRDSANFYPEHRTMQAFRLSVRKSTELDVTLYRKVDKDPRVQTSDVGLCVAIVTVETKPCGNLRIRSVPILSQHGRHKFVSTDGSLPEGTYLVLPFLFNPVNRRVDTTEFNIAVHTRYPIDLERVQIPLTTEREFLIKLCIIHGERVRKDEPADGVTVFELKRYWDGLILLVENRSPSKNVHFYFRCTLSQNAFMSRKDSYHQLFDVVPALHRQIIVTISRKNPAHSFTIGHDFQYVLSSQSFIKNHLVNKQKHWPNIDQSEQSSDIHLPQGIFSRERL